MRVRHLAVLGGIVLLSGAPGLARSHDGHNVSVRGPSGDTVRNCSDLRIEFDDRPALVAEEQFTVPRASTTVLSVRPERNGGVYVEGEARADIAVTACKAVAPDGDDGGPAALQKVQVTVGDGRAASSGPSNNAWIVYFLIKAPEGAALDLESTNGPVRVAHFSGRVDAHAQNGPIELKAVGGQISAHAQNGPIGFSGDQGAIELETQNGPISVELTGSRWSSGSLTAHVQNGPVEVKVPRDFRSTVRVESSNHSPWDCSGSCDEGRKSWDTTGRSIELGRGPVLVHVSTVNGPVSVKQTR